MGDLPEGFTIDQPASGAASSGPPEGFTIDKPTFASKAVEPITSYPETYRQRREGSVEMAKQGAEGLWQGQRDEPNPVKAFGKDALNLGKTLAGAYGYVTSPVNATLGTAVGKPVENLTGSHFAGELAETAAGMLIPGYGFTKFNPATVGKITETAGRLIPGYEKINSAHYAAPSVPAPVVDAVATARAAAERAKVAETNQAKARQFTDAEGRPIELSYGEAAQHPPSYHFEDMAEQGAYGEPAQAVATPIQRERFDVMHGAADELGQELGGRRPDVTNVHDAARVVNDEMRQHAERIAQTRQQLREYANSEEQAQTGMLADQERSLGDIVRGGGEEAGGARDTGELVGNAIRQRAQQARAGVNQAYESAFELPGEIHAGAFEGVGTRIKNDLSSRGEPVVVDDITTPIASRALQHIDKSIDQLKIQNRAQPGGAPNPENIVAVNLRGVDQLRKQLNQFYASARGGQNPSDARAMGQIIHAFDDQVESAVAGNLFSGDPRALQALRDARAAYRNYSQTFRPQGAGDDVGNAMRRIIDRNATPDEVANMVLGASATGNPGLPVRLAARLEQIFGRDSQEWSAVRQSLWQRASSGAANAEKQAQRIEQFANSTLGRQVFRPEELAAMRNHAQGVRTLEQTVSTLPARQQAQRFAQGYERFFGGRDNIVGGSPGQTLRKIAEGTAQPEDITKTIFAMIGSGRSGEASRAVDAIANIAGHDSPAFDMLRYGSWKAVTDAVAAGMNKPGVQKLSENVLKFVGSPVAKKLYSADELKRMKEFAEVVKLKVAPPKSKTNPSGSAVSLATMARRVLTTKIVPTVTHNVAALIGHGWMSVPAHAAAHALNVKAAKFGTAAEEAVHAAKVRKSLAGKAPDERKGPKPRNDYLGEFEPPESRFTQPGVKRGRSGMSPDEAPPQRGPLRLTVGPSGAANAANAFQNEQTPERAGGGGVMSLADGGTPDDDLPPIRPMVDAGAAVRKPVLSFDLYPKRAPEGPSPKVPSPDFIAPPPGLRQEPERLPEGVSYERPPGVLSPNAARSLGAGAVEPFGQAGRLMQGVSQDPSSDLAGVGAAIAPIGPPGAAKALGQAAKTAVRRGAERAIETAPKIDKNMIPFTLKGIENGTSTGTKAAELSGRGELPGGSRVLATPGRPDPAGGAVSTEPLAGLPRKVGIPGQEPIEAGPHLPARQAAYDYTQSAGLPYDPPKTYAKVDPARAERIAQAFEEMPHDPSDPAVQSAYKSMIDETLAQWNAIKKTGLQVDFMPPGVDYYAASPRLATEDVRRNNHLWVFSTKDGFGSGETISPESVLNNPLLAPTQETISGQPALANDIFRAVHDYFGHIKEGVGFRADGEENAWRSHSAMYSPEARRAMTTETRGQNSWLNYGPHGEANRTARTEDTKFADQKIGLLPDWVVNEGAHDPVASPAISTGRQLQPGTKEFNKAAAQAKAEIAAQGKGLGPLDLSTAKEIPGTPQVPLERHVPNRGISPRLQEALQNPEVVRGVEESVQHGIDQYGAQWWYHTEPIRRAFVDELGDEHGMKAFDQFMHMVAATSPRSDASTNVRNASFYYQKMLQGEELPKKNPQPYGHMAQALHARMARNIIDSYKAHDLGAAARPDPWDLMANPKPASFQANLTGNLVPGTMDTHAFRNIGMRTGDPRFLATSLQTPIKGTPGPESMVSRYGEVGGTTKKPMAIYRPQQLLKSGRLSMEEALKIPSFWATKPNPNEYAAAEQLYAQIGKKLGMPTADTQAAAWAGAGKLTGLETPPTHTFPELFNERVLFTSKMRGEEPKTTLSRFIRGEAPLLSVGGLLALGAGQNQEQRASGGRVSLRTRRESNYSPSRGTPDHHCGADRQWPEGFCAKFRGPHACLEVGGFIAAHGGCDWYKRAPQGRASGGRVLGHYVDLDPTEAQKAAGNYRKAHITVHGLGIAIENPRGSERHGVGGDGEAWAVRMPAHYGYIKGFIGRDKDHVDVYVGPYTKSKRSWVVEQHDEKSGRLDEAKIFLGFGSEAHVKRTYLAGFSDGKGPQRLGKITEMSIDELKSWLHRNCPRSRAA